MRVNRDVRFPLGLRDGHGTRAARPGQKAASEQERLRIPPPSEPAIHSAGPPCSSREDGAHPPPRPPGYTAPRSAAPSGRRRLRRARRGARDAGVLGGAPWRRSPAAERVSAAPGAGRRWSRAGREKGREGRCARDAHRLLEAIVINLVTVGK